MGHPKVSRRQAVLEHMRRNPGLSVAELAEAGVGNASRIRDALMEMLDTGWVRRERDGVTYRWYATQGPQTKECRGCKQHLPLTHFYSVPRNADGLNTLCRVCQSRENRRFRGAAYTGTRRIEGKRTVSAELQRERDERARLEAIEREQVELAGRRLAATTDAVRPARGNR